MRKAKRRNRCLGGSKAIERAADAHNSQNQTLQPDSGQDRRKERNHGRCFFPRRGSAIQPVATPPSCATGKHLSRSMWPFSSKVAEIRSSFCCHGAANQGCFFVRISVLFPNSKRIVEEKRPCSPSVWNQKCTSSNQHPEAALAQTNH